MTNKLTHLENLCVVHTDFDIWSGQSRLTVEDLKLGAGGEIPPEKLAQLGTKRICSTEKLKGFHRLKTATRRNLARFGMPFMNGFAIPVTKADEIRAMLEAVETEFKAMQSDFITGYNAAIDEWCREHPDYEQAIRNGALPRHEVAKRIGFDFQMFMVAAPASLESAQRLNGVVVGLGDDLLSEVTDEADKFFQERLAGSDRCGVTTKRTLRNLLDKLEGLSFLNSKIRYVIDLLEEAIKLYDQAQGRDIVGQPLQQLTAAILILSSKDRIDQYIAGAMSRGAAGQDASMATNSNAVGGAGGQTDSSESGIDDLDLFGSPTPSVKAASLAQQTPSAALDFKSLLQDLDAQFPVIKNDGETVASAEAESEQYGPETADAEPATTHVLADAEEVNSGSGDAYF